LAKQPDISFLKGKEKKGGKKKEKANQVFSPIVRGLTALELTGFSLLKATWTSTAIFFFFFLVLGLELRAYTLSHSTSPFLGRVFSR
jgi:hypothetical protein